MNFSSLRYSALSSVGSVCLPFCLVYVRKYTYTSDLREIRTPDSNPWLSSWVPLDHIGD